MHVPTLTPTLTPTPHARTMLRHTTCTCTQAHDLHPVPAQVQLLRLGPEGVVERMNIRDTSGEYAWVRVGTKEELSASAHASDGGRVGREDRGVSLEPAPSAAAGCGLCGGGYGGGALASSIAYVSASTVDATDLDVAELGMTHACSSAAEDAVADEGRMDTLREATLEYSMSEGSVVDGSGAQGGAAAGGGAEFGGRGRECSGVAIHKI